MKTIRYRKRLALAFAGLLILSAAGCTNTANTEGQTSSSAAVGVATAGITTDYSAEDTEATWSESDASAVITLNGSAIAVDGNGATAEGSTLTITSGGLYVVSGKLTDGQILVNAPSTDTVRIVLNGIDITSSTSAAIYELQADKLILTLAEGTQNTVTDAKNYTDINAAAEEPDATVFAKHDITINGAGSLQVNGNFKNGIGTKDDLLIVSGNLYVTAPNDALRGRDSVTILDGELKVEAGSDGIQSNNDEDASKGWVVLSGGSVTIESGGDGIQAETKLTVQGGTYAIHSGSSAVTTASTVDSYKGLKASSAIDITGGTFQINSTDDAIHSNGDIAISAGKFTISSDDDAIHADEDLTITDGTIDITDAYEGLEAATMTLAGGVITIASTDDGINIAGGNDGNAGVFGRDQFAVDGSQWLLISGGTITVVAGSDAIDINGNGTMSGGIVNLTAATLGEGQTLDVDGTWEKTAGELTESGGSGMGGPGGMGRPQR